MAYEVKLVACVEGNPTKAWSGTTGEHDTEHVPDDVWEDQTHTFDDLDAAKAFVRGLHPQVTTHVKLYADDELIFDQDAGADHLDDAAPGVAMPHTVDSGSGARGQVVEDLPVMPRQGAKQ